MTTRKILKTVNKILELHNEEFRVVRINNFFGNKVVCKTDEKIFSSCFDEDETFSFEDEDEGRSVGVEFENNEIVKISWRSNYNVEFMNGKISTQKDF